MCIRDRPDVGKVHLFNQFGGLLEGVYAAVRKAQELYPEPDVLSTSLG